MLSLGLLGRGSRRSEVAIQIGCALLGVLFVFHRELASGFRTLQVYALDPLFQNLILEHEWLWLSGRGAWPSLASPGFFHPQGGALFFADPTIGALPLYGVWRLFGVDPHVAYALCAILALLLTYAAFLALFRRGFGLSPVDSALAAFLVAFGAPRAAMINHPHQFLHYPTALALLALFRLADESAARSTRLRWAASFPLFVLLQAWSNIYLFAILLLWLTAAALFLLLDRGGRRQLARLPHALWIAGGVSGLAALAAFLPYASGFVHARSAIGGPGLDEIRMYLPRLASWVNPGGDHLLEPWLAAAIEPAIRSPVPWAQRLGIGLLATLVALVGIAPAARSAPFRWLGGGFVVLVLLTMSWPGGHSAWPWIVGWLTPFASLRMVSRIVLVGLVPLAYAFVLGLRRMARPPVRESLAIGLLLVVFAEQIQHQPEFKVAPRRTRAAAIAANVPADCDSFLYTRYHPNLARRHPRIHDRDHQTQQVDAMWAAIAAEKPTFNGYSGYAPTDWPLWPVILVSEQELGYQRRGLEEWIDRHDLGDETVCWVVLRFRLEQVVSARVERIRSSRP
ncbi:MAG: hypothetical protein AB7G12_04220 [Thermoanaerobaculia bacterium]